MRKINAKTAVPLAVVQERRTKRRFPTFWPGDRFWSFRYLSPGKEGEKCRPLGHDFVFVCLFVFLMPFIGKLQRKIQ